MAEEEAPAADLICLTEKICKTPDAWALWGVTAVMVRMLVGARSSTTSRLSLAACHLVVDKIAARAPRACAACAACHGDPAGGYSAR